MKIYCVGFSCRHPEIGNTTVGANVVASCASEAASFVENAKDYEDVNIFELTLLKGTYWNVDLNDTTVRFV